MKNYLVEPGTMLYDEFSRMVGWVVGKHDWGVPSVHKDWDVEWSNGKKKYYSEGSLQICIKRFNDLANQNGK